MEKEMVNKYTHTAAEWLTGPGIRRYSVSNEIFDKNIRDLYV